jgi:hypothetical protein
LQQWHTAHICYNEGEYFQCFIDGKSVATFDVDAIPDFTSNNIDTFDLGRYSSNYAGFYIDEVKLIDGCLLPFGGGPFTGNGEVNTSLAHSDILFHWDCESTSINIPSAKTATLNGSAAIVSGGVNGSYELDTIAYSTNHYASIPVVESDIINPHKGSFQAWIKINSSGSDYDVIFGFGDADDYLIIRISNTDELQYIYRSQSTYFTYNTGETLTVGQWYHIKAIWDDTDSIYLYLDGILPSTPAQVTKTWDGITSGTIYLGCNYSGGSGADVSFDQISITNDPNTPDRWSIFGKPIYYPLLEKNGSYLKYGTEMNAVINPEGSAIITDLGVVS